MANFRASVLTRLRLRPEAGETVPVLALIDAGDVAPAEAAPGFPGWLRFRSNIGQAKPLQTSAKNPFGPWLYASASLFSEVTAPAPIPVPVPAPTGTARVGISVLNAHHLLQPAYAAGVRTFLIMNGLQTARDFAAAHTDADVFYRKFLPHVEGLPNPDGAEMRELQTIGNNVILVSPANEGDIWPQNPGGGKSIDEVIGKRAAFDFGMATNCRRYGTRYAGGGWSNGNPDHTNADVCDALARYYAPHYNSGLMGLNCHLYSPVANNIFETDARQIWHEDRWRFYFDRCGFQNVANPVGVVADECGLDEGGIGGVPGHGLSGDYAYRWTRRARELWSMPVQGKKSPFRGGCWFQAGDNSNATGQWGSYNVEAFIQDIARANRD